MLAITSLTVDAQLLRNLFNLYKEEDSKYELFSAVLVSPLFASPSTLRFIREELKEKQGAIVYFDSGGYYAQQGRISFEELYCTLKKFYQDPANQWADWYVLPDHVPTSSDPPEVVEIKVKETITAARMFEAEMPSIIQERTIPVIQGHTFNHIQQCIEAYQDMGKKYVGFGSFGTNGSNQSVNVVDNRAVRILQYLVEVAREYTMRLHIFGVSTPPVIYAFLRMGIYSFDSLAWMRSAGYGKVFLPFTRAYNISHRSTRNKALTQEEFDTIRSYTKHYCPFCKDFITLQQSRLHRALHNLVVIQETAEPSPHLEPSTIANLIACKSSRYYRLFGGIYG